MKCRECTAAKLGWLEATPEAYVCIGGKTPFIIKDINAECTEYDRPAKTRADHIRSMSDEELVMGFLRMSSCPTCRIRGLCREQSIYDCKMAWLEWLRQPYEAGGEC